jgi:hypothetical protein
MHPYDDYAIVRRYIDPPTNGVTLIVAGIGALGTQAGSESVATPGDLEQLLISETRTKARYASTF